MPVKRLEQCALEHLPFRARILINIFALNELVTETYNTSQGFCSVLKRLMIDTHETNMRRTKCPDDVSNDILKLYKQLRRTFAAYELVSSCKNMSSKYKYVEAVCDASSIHCPLCTSWYKRHVTYWLSLFLLYTSNAVASTVK